MQRFLRHILFASVVVMLCAPAIEISAHDVAPVAVSDLSLNIRDDAPGNLQFKLTPNQLRVASEGEIVITPVLMAADSSASLRMPGVVVAGRNHMLRYSRGQRKLPEGVAIYSCKDVAPVSYNQSFDFENWMKDSRLSFDVQVQGCCGKTKVEYAYPIADVKLSKPELTVPQTFRLQAVVKGDPKIIDLMGSAFVDFRVNRTEIDPAYRRNVEELKKITSTIDVAINNPDATITSLSIKGYASPEGSYANNVRLAKGRTAALKDYIKGRYGLDERLFHTDFEAEDWGGLRDSVMSIPLPDAAGLLKIIDSDMEPDAKDAALKREYPKDYAYLLENVYPALRHSDYVVTYKVREFTTPDDIRKALREHPENVNEKELLMLLGACIPGSEEFDSVVEQGIGMFPKNADLQYLYGVKLASSGSYQQAIPHLHFAKDSGIPEASQALQSINEVLNPRPDVTYLQNRIINKP